MQYWLFKTEPGTYSIDDLKKEDVTEWYGIRNYQARNFLRDLVQSGDKVLIYHSNAKEIGVVGEGMIVGAAYPDTEQFKKKSSYYDVKSSPEAPRWVSCDVRFVKKYKNIVTLSELKKQKQLANMRILQRGNRLSITPVTREEFVCIQALAKKVVIV